MNDAHLGYCGLYCIGCGVYQATAAGKPMLGEDGSAMACDGCASGRTTPWCTECAIKTCARDKGNRLCIDCAENPCDKLQAFMDDPKWPYHRRVQNDMRRLREIGPDAWASEIGKRYVCASCGKAVNWLESTCPGCARATGNP